MVLEKWFCKLGFFFLVVDPEKGWVYTIHPPFFQVAEPLF